MRVVLDSGTSIELGDTEATPTIGITDYSRRVTDDYGVTTVVERGFSRRMSVKLGIPFDGVSALQQRLADLRALSALWVADEQIAWLSARGFYKEFELDHAVPPLSYCTLTVEGLAETTKAADNGSDPAPFGALSTLSLLQPVAIDSSVLVSSTVAETDAPEWSAQATYALGARVMKAATHRIYEAAIGGNVGNDPAGVSGKWLDVGPTNAWAMFDQALGTQTTAATRMAVNLQAPNIQAVALLDVIAQSVRVQATGYDRTVQAAGGTITFLDLPAGTSLVKVTLVGDVVSVGTLLIGQLRSLGITEASPTAGITDYSRKFVDDFGEVTIVPRAWSKRMTAKSLIRTDAVDVVANRIAAVRAVPSLWIGQAGLDSLMVYGFFKDFSIEVGPSVSKLSLSIEGLSKAAPIAPVLPAAPVAWPDVTDPTGTKPADNADVTGEHTSKDTNAVNGRPAAGVIEAIDKAKTDVDALVATFGSTENAAASANAARDAEANATTARDAALGARDAAAAARDLALGYRNAAQTGASDATAASASAKAARDLATQKASDAATSATGASGSATTASGQATVATQKADAAGQSATTASAKADIATTKAGEASASSARAATSESNAAGSATSASASQAVTASNAIAVDNLTRMSIPIDFSQGGQFVTQVFNGENPAPLNNAAATYPTVAGVGKVLNILTGDVQIETRGYLTTQPGNTYRASTRLRRIAGSSTAFIKISGLDSGFTHRADHYVTRVVAVADGWVDLTVDWTCPTTVPTTDVYLRAYVAANYSTSGGAEAQVALLKLENVTAIVAAQAAATASATSASNAATSKTGADQAAAASLNNATSAQTARGQAETFASQASSSRDSAVGSASTATTQAGVAVQAKTDAVAARDQAGTSATAAAGSASTATTKADAAGQAATSASASLNAAKTAQGSAEAARDQAAQSKTDAAGSASSALSSATLAAGSATTAGQKATAAATSEQNAASSATTAGQQASASEASKTAAQTARGQAETFANQASTSKDTAAGSASTASTQAGLAAQSKADANAAASAANTSASTASTKADAAGASGSASAASTSAAAASASASSAASSATIATSYSSGSVGINDKFANWEDPAGLPNGWAAWERGGNFRWERRAGGMGSAYYVKTLNETSNVNSGFYQTVPVHPGKWIVEVTAAIDANNSWVGSGVTDGIWRIDFAAEADNNQTFASSSANGAPRSWSKLVSIPAGQTSMNLHAMHGWDGFGSARDPKYMNWYVLSFRPATQPEIDSGKALANAATNAARIEQVNSTLSGDLGALATRTQSVEARAGGIEARTGIVETAVASATSKLAAARLELSAVSPGGRAQLVVRSDSNNGAGVDIVGDFRVSGDAIFGIVRSADGNATLNLDTGRLSFTKNGYRKVDGAGLGPNSNMVLWFGPATVAAGQETIANSRFALATDGKVYYGGVEVGSGAASQQTAGLDQLITKTLDVNQTLLFDANVLVEQATQTGTLIAIVYGYPVGTPASMIAQGAGGAISPNEPGTDRVAGAFTNTTGVKQAFSFRVSANSYFGGQARPSRSYLTI